jgi:hypothetical protein
MHRIKIVGLALVAVLAMGAMAATTASAKQPPLTLLDPETGAAVPLGTEIEMYGGINFATPSATMNCSEYGLSDFYGKVAVNQTTKDSVSVTSPIEIFGNIGGAGACEASTVLGTANVVQVSGFPATLTLTSAGHAKLVPTSGKVAFRMEFSGGAKCQYERANLAGVVGTPLSWAPAELQFTAQKFMLNGGLSTGKTCAALGKPLALSLDYGASYIEPWTNPHESLIIFK